jgi:hypothetical protein
MCLDRNSSIFRVFSPNYNIIRVHSQVANCEWKHNCSCTHTYINLKVNTVVLNGKSFISRYLNRFIAISYCR